MTKPSAPLRSPVWAPFYRFVYHKARLFVLVTLVFLPILAATRAEAQGGGGYSLRFYGHGVAAPDLDRVKIQIDDPTNTNPGPPADVGATDFTLEFWMKASAAENTAGVVSCGNNDNWIYGNIIFDRDRFNQDRKYGLSIAGGSFVFGVSGDGTGDYTICGTTNVVDNQWHHVAVQRRRSDGWMWLFVDGALEATQDGPDGDISYPDDGVPGDFCGGPCTNSDPYLVIGAEKHDAGTVFPSFSGFVDEAHLSNSLRYTSAFTPSSVPFVPDGSTVALYHFDEGPAGACTGTVLDSSGASGGPSQGTCKYGGSNPAGPVYSTDIPFAGDTTPTATPQDTPTPFNTPTVTNTPLPTDTPTPPPTSTLTPTATSTPLPTSMPTATNTPLPSNTPTRTATNTPLPSSTPTPTPTATPAPVSNFALSFDGANDVVRAGQVAGTGPLTVEVWVRPATNNADGLLVVGADAFDGWSLELNGGQLTFWLSSNQGWFFDQNGIALQAGEWYHVAASYSDGSARTFVNGASSSSTSVSTLSQGPSLSMGGFSGYAFYAGAMDEIRISNIVRYSSNFSPPTTAFMPDANTLGLWHFDEGSGQTAADTSASGNHATLGTTGGNDSADPTWTQGFFQ